MSRKSYSDYEYKDDYNLYTYPGTEVLRNLLDLKISGELSRVEYEQTTDKLFSLYLNPIFVYAMNDVCKIHKYLFEDLYQWAGEYRKVNISKEEKAYMAMQSFEMGTMHLDELIEEYNETAVTEEDIILGLSIILDRLNYMHPFREGNGRTQREVIRVLALAKGYEANINIQDNKTYHLYMDGTVYEDLNALKELFKHTLKRKTID